MRKFRYRLKVAQRQRLDFEGEWIEVETARPAPINFLNASKFFLPFLDLNQFLVQFMMVEERGD